LLLEAQEYYTDVFFQTHNVRGTFDVVNDLVVGLGGASITPSFTSLSGGGYKRLAPARNVVAELKSAHA
jgi:hypothetical protein